jgi:hypothetical protein
MCGKRQPKPKQAKKRMKQEEEEGGTETTCDGCGADCSARSWFVKALLLCSHTALTHCTHTLLTHCTHTVLTHYTHTHHSHTVLYDLYASLHRFVKETEEDFCGVCHDEQGKGDVLQTF